MSRGVVASIVCREVLLPQLCVERCCWLNCVSRGVVNCVSRGVVGSIVCREVLLPQLCVERCCCLNCV